MLKIRWTCLIFKVQFLFFVGNNVKRVKNEYEEEDNHLCYDYEVLFDLNKNKT